MNSTIGSMYRMMASFAIPFRSLLIVTFALALLSAALRFVPWMPGVFFGDDLDNIIAYKNGYFPSGMNEAFGSAYAEKYRPFFVWPMSVLFQVFDDNIIAYMVVNVVLHALNATIVFAIAYELSRGNRIVSLAIAVAAATSRFALYQVTQVTGLLEGVALTFFLLMTYGVVRAGSASPQSAWRWSWFALLMAFLVINTHERYIVVAVWLFISLMVLPGTRVLSQNRLAKLAMACVVVGLLNVAFKVLVLDMDFFVGTGGTHLDFDVFRVWVLITEALLSIFGINEGPEYLVAFRTLSLGWLSPILLLAVVVAIVWLGTLIAGVAVTLSDKKTEPALRWERLYLPVLLLILAGLLIGPPALTIRMEQRWILAPFILMLLLVAWAAGVQKQRAILPVSTLALAIGFGTVISDTFIAAHFGQIFFVSAGDFATVAKRDVADKFPGKLAPVAFLAYKEQCSWSLLDGNFFRIYGGARRPVFCFDSIAAIKSASLPEDTTIYGPACPFGLQDVTSRLATPVTRSERIRHDFITLFPQGRINDLAEVQSPTGRGVMIIPRDSFSGLLDTLTVISGFSYSYDGVMIEPDADLRFGVTMVYPSADSARAIVQIEEEGAPSRVLYSEELTPPCASDTLQFESISIPLAAFVDKKVSITFRVETPWGKNSNGHWVAFSEPRIVLDTSPADK